MYITRELENKIIEYMCSKEIIAVIGTCQCGKTTLINHILEHYENVNSITFEDVDNKILFEENIESFVELHVKDTIKTYNRKHLKVSMRHKMCQLY